MVPSPKGDKTGPKEPVQLLGEVGLVAGRVPDMQKFHLLALVVDSVEDPIAQAEDFSYPPVWSPAVGWTDLREAFEKANVIKKLDAHFVGSGGIILRDVLADLGKILQGVGRPL